MTDHSCEWGGFDRTICPLCDAMHNYCVLCGENDCEYERREAS